MNRHILSCALFLCGFGVAMFTAYAQTNNCITDFSTTNNPNGVWSYGLADDSATNPSALYSAQSNFIGLGAGWDTGSTAVPGMAVSSSWPGIPNPALVSHASASASSALTYTVPAPGGRLTISGGYFKGTEPTHLARNARTRILRNGVVIYSGSVFANDRGTTGAAGPARPHFTQSNPKPYLIPPFGVLAGDRIQITNDPHEMTSNNSESVFGQNITCTFEPGTNAPAPGTFYRLDQAYQTVNNPFGSGNVWSFHDQTGALMVPATGTFGFSGATWEKAGNPNAPPAIFQGASFGLASSRVVYGHTPAGPGNYFEIHWTAPEAGTASIDGMAYSAIVGSTDLSDRWLDVQVYRYDSTLASDVLLTESGSMTKSITETTQPTVVDVESNQASPLSFLSFTGGAAAVSNITLQAGDKLKFRCRTAPNAPTPSGSFIAVDPEIYFVPNSSPSVPVELSAIQLN
jgi:hypothetical protein